MERETDSHVHTHKCRELFARTFASAWTVLSFASVLLFAASLYFYLLITANILEFDMWPVWFSLLRCGTPHTNRGKYSKRTHTRTHQVAGASARVACPAAMAGKRIIIIQNVFCTPPSRLRRSSQCARVRVWERFHTFTHPHWHAYTQVLLA